MSAKVYVIATMDTKGAEATYVRDRLAAAGTQVVLVDVGTLASPTHRPDVDRREVLSAVAGAAPRSLPNPDGAVLPTEGLGEDRGQAIATMAAALRHYLQAEVAAGRVAGVLGLGGSGGTSLITTALRALPIGLPKLMVSTVASGNVAPYVDCSDILMLYSVVDIAGLNAVSSAVLANAAHAMAGMVFSDKPAAIQRPAVGMTMFGVTTPCVNRVRELLEAQGYDGLVFHATGSGGRAMEQLVASGLISGVLDITTTEVADTVVGGVFGCGPDRFARLLAAEIPLVLSLGALDMVNFGGLETVPPMFQQRRLHVHNAQVTLMRTSAEENVRIAAFMAERLNRATAPWRLLVPELGLSLIDVPGQPFHDPQANAVLFQELERRLELSPERRWIRLPYAINAPEFAAALVDHFLQLMGRPPVDPIA
jgi:uncharacterized protein (UPF0261 family)